MAANSPPSPPSPSQLPPVPASPTYSYASTANPLSQYNLPPPPPPPPTHAVLTKTDLAHSQAAYADLLTSAKAYRLALASLSTAASTFGSALESCARLKEARAELSSASAAGMGAGAVPGGPPLPPGAPLSNSFTTAAANRTTASSACTADTLLATAGLQHLVANHQHILSETVYRAFELPLLHDLDRWRGAVDDEEDGYARALEAQSREIRRLEKEGVKMHRQRRPRDVGQLRRHLVELTGKLDALTVLHGEHARTLLAESQEASGRIVEASCSLVRAEVDIFESLARKGWTGGGLEEVLEKGVDLFAAEMDPLGGGGGGGGGGMGKGGGGGGSGGGGGEGGSSGEGTTLFSILPPKSILADTSGAADAMRGAKGTRSDSLLVDTDRYQSLAGAVTASDLGTGRDRDADSVFSEFNRSRNLRPFSPQPQPLKLNPEDLLGGIESLAVEASSSSGKGGRRGEHDGIEEVVDEECAVEEDHEEEDQDDEEIHPWRNEGLRRDSTDDEAKDTVGASLGDPQQREGTWSDTNDST